MARSLALLGIFYYSRQEDPVENNLFKFYGRVASISGSTLAFSPSFAISDVASLPEFGRDSMVNPTYISDYDMAAATPGAAISSKMDGRQRKARDDLRPPSSFLSAMSDAKPGDWYSKALLNQKT
jgi:hypothetical protein